jgi:hypothetical protein
MSGERRTPPHDPTAERTAEQTTQGAGGLHKSVGANRPGSLSETGRDADDTAYRNDGDLYETPRRYDSEDNDKDPVMPSDGSTLGTKI